MAETKVVLVPDGLNGERVDAAIARMLGLSRTRCTDLIAAGRVRLDGGPVRAGAGVRGDADGLVDPHAVVVVVDDGQPRDRLGCGRLPRRRGQLDLQPAPAADPVTLAAHPAVDDHRTRVGEVGGHAAGEAEEPGQRLVDALPVEPVGHREGPVLARGSAHGVHSDRHGDRSGALPPARVRYWNGPA